MQIFCFERGYDPKRLENKNKIVWFFSIRSAPSYLWIKVWPFCKLCREYALLQRIYAFAENIHFCREYTLLQTIYAFADNIHFCREYTLLQRIYTFAESIRFCREYTLLQRIYAFADNIRFCREYTLLEETITIGL